jgi:ABC-type proline/glycine betaine transport system ATPase subunit
MEEKKNWSLAPDFGLMPVETGQMTVNGNISLVVTLNVPEPQTCRSRAHTLLSRVNIGEACGPRRSGSEFRKHLSTLYGSCYER